MLIPEHQYLVLNQGGFEGLECVVLHRRFEIDAVKLGAEACAQALDPVRRCGTRFRFFRRDVNVHYDPRLSLNGTIPRIAGARNDHSRPHALRSRRSRDHSGLMPATLMTLAHFTMSAAMNLPKSAPELTSGAPPRSMALALIIGSESAAAISRLSFSTISAGVPLGATSPP